MKKLEWHTAEIETVLEALETDRNGISDEEAEKRLEEFGLNELKEEKKTTWLQLLVSQFKSILVVILIFSAIVSAYIAIRNNESMTDTWVILFIVIINAILGFIQEYRAEQAVEALKKMVSPQVLILRDGREKSIDSKFLVPGDIILIEAGSRIPSDARLIEAASLQIDEAALTGESRPVTKYLGLLLQDSSIGDRSNMAYMGTVVTGGRAVAVVTETGMTTEFGKIAGMVQAVEVEDPPLRQKMEKMGRQLALISIILTISVFVMGFFIHKMNLEALFMTAISLAVSAIPEGLPAVLTITLALGTARMARQKAIVRKLASVETLGSTTVICSDKTGTLTKNEMTVSRISNRGRIINVTGAGYIPNGDFFVQNEVFDPINDKDINLLLHIGGLSNDAHLQNDSGSWTVFGDPTEGALVVAAAKAGFTEDMIRETYPRVAENPFNSARKMMSTLHKTNEGNLVGYVKGAPEIIIERSTQVLEDGTIRPITDEDKEEVLELMQKMAGDALRVLAMAFKEFPLDMPFEDFNLENAEHDLVYVGLVGMIDPPREEVPEAIQICKQAGIRTVMVTGDHRLTAVAIAKEIGMIDEESSEIVFTGDYVEKIDDDKLDEIIENARVFARVSPEHKMRIAQSLKRKGHVVAMTGDGVNDAPALKTADIGIAMGIKGTDVTKEASDMVLEDDNFATIVRAVEGGRHIYENVTKYLRLMLAANFDEFIEITIVMLLGLPAPFLPIHILWINLITDGLPAIALSIDPKNPDLMKYPPRSPQEGILSRFWRFIIFAALVDFISDFIPFLWTYASTGSETRARSVAFTCIVFFEFFLAYQCRSETKHIFAMGLEGWTANKMLFVSIVIGVALQFMILYIPVLNTIFHVVPLSMKELLICFLGSLTAFLIIPGKLIPKRRYLMHQSIT